MPTFSFSTELPITPEAFWSRMSMSAVNAELRPLVCMTAPAAFRRAELSQWATGRVLFRSVVLLFCCLPVDVHALRLERVEMGRGFLERSSSWSNRLWQHERTTRPTAAGCVLTDTVTVEGRVPFVTRLLMPVYGAVFRHRHRRLKQLYGSVPASRAT